MMSTPRILMLLSLATALGGCAAPDAVAPTAESGVLAHEGRGGRQRGHQAKRRERHEAHQKYRDRGAPRARGREGNAAITAQLLVGAAGDELVVTSYHVRDLEAPAGRIARVVLKVYGANGQVVTRSFDGSDASTFTAPLRGLAPGVGFEVQVLVRGIDRNRTDVVRARGVSAAGPDLAVLGVTVPERALAGLPTIVSATVAEVAGGTGTRTDCVLFVNEVERDRAANIWVDAGDMVTCAFSPTFDTPGTYQVRVTAGATGTLLRQVVAGAAFTDPDAANNSASATITVVPPANVTGNAVSGAVRSGVFTSDDTVYARLAWPDGRIFLEQALGRHETGSLQMVLTGGSIGAALAFPLTRVEIAMRSGATLLHQASATDIAADPGSASGTECFSMDAGQATSFYLCSNALGFTQYTYTRDAGSVTYQSTEYQKTWNGAGHDEATWVDNGTIDRGAVAPLGADVAFDVRITAGGTLYQSGGIALLAPFTETAGEPFACVDEVIDFPPDLFDARSCLGSSYTFTGVTGDFTAAAGSGLRLARSR